MRKLFPVVAAAAMAAAMASAVQAQQPRPVYTPEGLVRVPAFELPPSGLMSPEAVAALKSRASTPPPGILGGSDIVSMRRRAEAQLAPVVQEMSVTYPTLVVQQKIAGVPVRVITSKSGPVDRERVLINLHGGGHMLCAEACALVESLPIASLGGFKVISVDYRQAPEATFPAATEDVVAVYLELLKSYKPKQIGIYGCSAGGSISAQVAAWLPAHGLPQAGAIGIFGSGATRVSGGDSAYVSAYIDGSFPPPPPPGAPPPPRPIRSYFEGADLNDPMVSPAGHLDVLAKFPPTLVITGTRAFEMSAAVYTHSQLVKAGVPGDLIVGEGLGHCYMYTPGLPESQDAYRAIVRFFKTNLG